MQSSLGASAKRTASDAQLADFPALASNGKVAPPKRPRFCVPRSPFWPLRRLRPAPRGQKAIYITNLDYNVTMSKLTHELRRKKADPLHIVLLNKCIDGPGAPSTGQTPSVFANGSVVVFFRSSVAGVRGRIIEALNGRFFCGRIVCAGRLEGCNNTVCVHGMSMSECETDVRNMLSSCEVTKAVRTVSLPRSSIEFNRPVWIVRMADEDSFVRSMSSTYPSRVKVVMAVRQALEAGGRVYDPPLGRALPDEPLSRSMTGTDGESVDSFAENGSGDEEELGLTPTGHHGIRPVSDASLGADVDGPVTNGRQVAGAVRHSREGDCKNEQALRRERSLSGEGHREAERDRSLERRLGWGADQECESERKSQEARERIHGPLRLQREDWEGEAGWEAEVASGQDRLKVQNNNLETEGNVQPKAAPVSNPPHVSGADGDQLEGVERTGDRLLNVGSGVLPLADEAAGGVTLPGSLGAEVGREMPENPVPSLSCAESRENNCDAPQMVASREGTGCATEVGGYSDSVVVGKGEENPKSAAADCSADPGRDRQLRAPKEHDRPLDAGDMEPLELDFVKDEEEFIQFPPYGGCSDPNTGAIDVQQPQKACSERAAQNGDAARLGSGSGDDGDADTALAPGKATGQNSKGSERRDMVLVQSGTLGTIGVSNSWRMEVECEDGVRLIPGREGRFILEGSSVGSYKLHYELNIRR